MFPLTLHAEFDHYIDAPVPWPSITLLQDWITILISNYHA